MTAIRKAKTTNTNTNTNTNTYTNTTEVLVGLPVAAPASMADLRVEFPHLFAEVSCAQVRACRSAAEREKAYVAVFTRYALMSAHSGIGMKDKAWADMSVLCESTKDGRPSKATAKWHHCRGYVDNLCRTASGQSLEAYRALASEARGTLLGIISPEPAFPTEPETTPEPAFPTEPETTPEPEGVDLERIKGMSLDRLDRLEALTRERIEMMQSILSAIAEERSKTALL
jgi:hypothetical protein